MTGPLSTEQIAGFQEDGYLFVENLLDAEEVALLQTAVRSDAQMMDSAMAITDTAGRRTNLALWNHPGDDIYGMIARSERVVHSMQQLLGDEVYHYHSKLSAKQPKVGGAWEWHQDYGYWYQNGCLYPDMASLYIAIDRATQENGCMQALKGSHLMGRIEHGRYGGQTGADPDRVALAKERMELIFCEMEPGTGFYFHSNLLHASAANESELPRWGMISCYNTKHNDPVDTSHHPGYTAMDVVPDSAIKEKGAVPSQAAQEFMNQEKDRTTG